MPAQTKIKIKEVKVGNCKQLNLSAKIIISLLDMSRGIKCFSLV